MLSLYTAASKPVRNVESQWKGAVRLQTGIPKSHFQKYDMVMGPRPHRSPNAVSMVFQVIKGLNALDSLINLYRKMNLIWGGKEGIERTNE